MPIESCRACMVEGNARDMHFLFGANPAVDDLFGTLTSIKIEQGDGLPTFICPECVQKLHQFQEFVDTCNASNRMYQEQLQIQLDIKEDQCYYENAVEFSPDEDAVSLSVYDSVDIDGETFEQIEVKPYEIEETFTESNPDDPVQSKYPAADYLAQHIIVKSNGDSTCSASTRSAVPPVHFECDICGKICHKRHRIEAHLRQHCGLKPFACSTCGVSFQKWSSYQLHSRKHNTSDVPLDVFPCTFDGCTKSYDLRQSLKVHYDRVHLGIKPNRLSGRHCICETCGKSFTTEFFLRAHSYTHVGKEYWPFPCELCPKRFISKYKFKIHMMRHNNIKNFACPLCEMRTCTNKELQIHIAYHNEANDFVCESCPSTFRSKVALQRHQRIVHRGHKPYECTFCGLTFAKAETLKHHTMRHTGEKPHACQLCNRRFIQVVALRAHMKTHNKNKTPTQQAVPE